MKFVKGIWVRFLNLVAAALTAAFCFVPAWVTHLAIDAGLVPVWFYVFAGGLALVGAGVVLAFLEKAWHGKPPLG